jgi:hypothetical protein
MSIFSTILEKLGFKKPAAQVTPAPQAPALKPTPTMAPPPPSSAYPPPQPKPAPTMAPPPPSGAYPPPQPKPQTSSPGPGSGQQVGIPMQTAAYVAPMEMVDVVSKMEKLAKDAGGGLDWKASIVDLLKILHMDSSLEARKELAVELGCPPEKMKESQNMNIWLHKAVLQKIAENGGNVPKELLD